MFIVTTLSQDDLGNLIRDGQVSLDNGSLVFGDTFEVIDNFFKNGIASDGYVIGLRGRLNSDTVKILSKLDKSVRKGEHVILETEVSEDDLIRYRVSGVSAAVNALYCGMTEETVKEQLEDSQVFDSEATSAEILCVPYISRRARVRVTSFGDNLSFNVEGMTFVKLRKEGR